MGKMDAVAADHPDWTEIKGELQACARRGFLGPALREDVLRCFTRKIIAEIYRGIEALPVVGRGKKVAFDTSLAPGDILPERIFSNFCGEIRRFFTAWSGEIQGVSVIPQVEFKYNHLELDDYYIHFKYQLMLDRSPVSLTDLDHAELFPVDLIIHSDQELSAPLMRDLLALTDRLRVHAEIYPYQVTRRIAFPLIKNYKQTAKQIKTPLLTPVFFYFAAQPAFCVSGVTAPDLPRTEMMISPLAEKAIRRDFEFLTPEFKDTHLVKTCTPGFLRFFMTAVRTKIFMETLKDPVAWICIAPRDTFDRLYRDYPQHRDWLERFYGQFQRNLDTRRSDTPLFFTKALSLLNNDPLGAKYTADQDLSVSVIILTADREQDIVECLDSLCRQTRIPDEVVIIDNGQGKGVSGLVSAYRPALNIKYFPEKKKGIPFARNAGLKHASCDILAFIDDDCVADSHWLEKLVAPFLEDRTIGVVGGYLSGIGRTDKVVEKYYDFILLSRFGQSN